MFIVSRAMSIDASQISKSVMHQEDVPGHQNDFRGSPLYGMQIVKGICKDAHFSLPLPTYLNFCLHYLEWFQRHSLTFP